MKASHAVKRFIEDLLEKVPALVPIYDEHLRDYDTLIPHVFLGDVTRFVVALVNESPLSNELKAVLDVLEVAMSKEDEEISELISVSFLENLIGEVRLEDIKIMLGKNLLCELSKKNI